MGVIPIFPAGDALTTEELVEHLKREVHDLSLLIPAGRETPIAFVGSIGLPLIKWALKELPRVGSGNAGSTENERMLLHDLIGTLNALIDIY